MTPDGTWILGSASAPVDPSDDSRAAWLWSDETGLIDLRNLFHAQGLDVSLTGWEHLIAKVISPDGHTIAGEGLNPDGTLAAWVAYLDPIVVIAGDFNFDGELNCQDVDRLVEEITRGDNAAPFDLTDDGLVDTTDLDEWLVQAGEANLPSGNPYLPGDANLDGAVDASDFNIWNSNRLSQTPAWCAGDFNADGFVDASDFNIWNSHRFMSSAGAPAAVPEPEALWLSFIAVAWLAAYRRRG